MVSSLAKLKKGSDGFSRFRESKLTHFLKDSLGGNAFILLIACISLEERVIEDSMRTLDFARSVKNIKVTEVKKNETSVIAVNEEFREELEAKDALILKQKEQIANLEKIVSR